LVVGLWDGWMIYDQILARRTKIQNSNGRAFFLCGGGKTTTSPDITVNNMCAIITLQLKLWGLTLPAF
jgi:hypothetical protein